MLYKKLRGKTGANVVSLIVVTFFALQYFYGNLIAWSAAGALAAIVGAAYFVSKKRDQERAGEIGIAHV